MASGSASRMCSAGSSSASGAPRSSSPRSTRARRCPAAGLIFHSDRGCQYTSAEFSALLGRHGLVQSLSRPGQCWEGAVAESFFATLKEELLYRGSWPTRDAAKRAIFEYVEIFYNRQRMHSTLDYLTPVAYEARRWDMTATQAA